MHWVGSCTLKTFRILNFLFVAIRLYSSTHYESILRSEEVEASTVKMEYIYSSFIIEIKIEFGRLLYKRK